MRRLNGRSVFNPPKRVHPRDDLRERHRRSDLARHGQIEDVAALVGCGVNDGGRAIFCGDDRLARKDTDGCEAGQARLTGLPSVWLSVHFPEKMVGQSRCFGPELSGGRSSDASRCWHRQYCTDPEISNTHASDDPDASVHEMDV